MAGASGIDAATATDGRGGALLQDSDSTATPAAITAPQILTKERHLVFDIHRAGVQLGGLCFSGDITEFGLPDYVTQKKGEERPAAATGN